MGKRQIKKRGGGGGEKVGGKRNKLDYTVCCVLRLGKMSYNL